MTLRRKVSMPLIDKSDFTEVAAAIAKIPPQKRPAALSAVRAMARGALQTTAEIKTFDFLLENLFWKAGRTPPAGRADIQCATDFSRSAITRGLQKLVAKGFILPWQHWDGHRRQRNTYTFPHVADFFDPTQELEARVRAGKRLGRRKRRIGPMYGILKGKRKSVSSRDMDEVKP